MKSNISVADVLELTIAERIEFVEDVWDSIIEEPEAVKLSEEQKNILESRLSAYHKDHEAGSPWKEIKERIRLNS